MKFTVIFIFMTSFAFSETLSINQFKGLNTDDPEIWLEDGQTADAENVRTDEGPGLLPREGFTSFSTQTSNNLWTFSHSNGNNYLITQSSNQILATIGSGNFTIPIASINITAVVDGSQLGDRWYFVDKSSGLRYWDGTSVVVASAALLCNQIETHKGRLWLTGKDDDPRTIYGSEYLNGSNFNLAVNPVETDPVRIQVQGALDEKLTALYASFNDLLIWMKGHSFGGIYGSRRSQFSPRSFSETVGTSYPESIRDCNGKLRWLANDRQIIEFDGKAYRKLTENNDTFMGTVLQGDLGSRSWTQTSQADWNVGTIIGNLSTTLSVGDIVMSSRSYVWDDFEDGDFTSNPVWTVTDGAASNFQVSAGNLRPTQGVGNVTRTISIPSNVSTGTWRLWGNYNFGNALSAKQCQVFFMSDNSSGTRGSYSVDMNWPSGGSDNTTYRFIRYSSNSVLEVLQSTVISRTVDISTLTITRSSTGTITMLRQHTVQMLKIEDSTITSSNWFSIRYSTEGSDESVGVAFFSDIRSTYPVEISTFISQSFNVGDKITSWGTFSANQSLNNETISYGIYSDTNNNITINNGTTYIASQTIASGDVPYISTGSYVTISAEFSRNFSTNTPTLNDFKIQWNEGSDRRVSSLYTGNRYWLGVTISSTANNSVIVYDRNNNLHVYKGINMDAAVTWQGDPYYGNSIGIFKAESGATDNGSNINAYFKTKGYLLGKVNRKKMFENIYMTTDNSDATLQTQYYVDGINSPRSLSNYLMNSEIGMQDFKLPFPLASLKHGKSISFKWTVNGGSEWRILNGNLNYTTNLVDSD